MMSETSRAKQAWADYVTLGPGRSLEKLAALYQSSPKPTPLRTLKGWSSAFGWQARLIEIANREAIAAEEREAAYRRSILEDGYALAHERVKALKDLGQKLHAELTKDGKLWVTDVKGIGGGDSWERVDVERFNAAEVDQYRGILDDIAKETGGRKQSVEHSGSVEIPIKVLQGVDLDRV